MRQSTLRVHGVSKNRVTLLQTLYSDNQCEVKHDTQTDRPGFTLTNDKWLRYVYSCAHKTYKLFCEKGHVLTPVRPVIEPKRTLGFSTIGLKTTVELKQKIQEHKKKIKLKQREDVLIDRTISGKKKIQCGK